MVRKKAKPTSKKNINNGNSSGAGEGGGSDFNALASSSSSLVVNFVGTSGGQNSSSTSTTAALPRDSSAVCGGGDNGGYHVNAHASSYLAGSGSGGGGSDVNACASSASLIVNLVGSGGRENFSSTYSAAGATPRDDQNYTEKLLINDFYEKLVRFHQSSGLSFVFNFREAKLDLYLLYKKVTERGGFHQVSKEGRWIEVASLLNLKIQVSLLPEQIQKVHQSLLLQYEQMHCYRTPAKVQKPPDYVKRKSSENPHQDDQLAKKKFVPDTLKALKGHGTPEQKSNIQMHIVNKDVTKDLQAPQKPRNTYQLFVKMECERMKKIHGETSGKMNFRNMAAEAWKHLSESDRQPYVEASRKDKERYIREMLIYEQIRNPNIAKIPNMPSNTNPGMIKFGASSPKDDGCYYVTLEADAGNYFIPDETMVESAIQMLKNSQSNDPMLQILNWEGRRGSQD